MPRYKRTFDEAELENALEPVVQTGNVEMLSKLRNMWEFASFMQYIYLFGSVVKIDNDFDIEDLETECLTPQPSEKLASIGLQLLKYVSSHRGLTPEIFDEYTRRQYVAKAPRRNPFGEEEEPAKFNDFDVYTKVRVLHQLSTWTLGNAERIRGMMSQEEDHLGWRIEPIGWDKEDRAYFVLDDDRLYRRTDEPVPPPTPKLKPKAKAKTPKKSRPRGTRASKRRRIEDTSDEEPEEVEAETGADGDTIMTNGEHAKQEEEGEEEAGFGFTSKTWECVAITLEEYQEFLASIFRTRDPNEKQLRKTIEESVLPIIEKRADQMRQKQLKKMRDLENLHKMASAKRSSRLADKAEREKVEREEREAEDKRQRELKMAHEEQERQRRIEEGHESRRLTREQRLKEREVKRILHEEELAKLEDVANRASSQDPGSDAAIDSSKRMSERQIKTQREKHQKELERMAEEEDNWVFDCAICGVHGENLDDGTHSIACERCNVWQHSKCHGFSPKQAEKDGFHFVCGTCKRKEADARKPKIPPLKLGKKKSPEVRVVRPSQPPATNGDRPGALPDHIARQLDNFHYYQPTGPQSGPGPFGRMTNGPTPSPNGHVQTTQYQRYPPVSNFAPQPRPPSQPWQSSPLSQANRPPSSGYMSSPPPPVANGYISPVQHQHQHQYVHQNAVAAAGGHPGYQPSYGQQMYRYGTGAPGSMYQPPPPQHPQNQQYYPPPASNTNYNSSYQQPPSHRNGSAHLTNGAHSPTKAAPKLSASPPQYDFNRQPSLPQPPPAHQNQHSAGDQRAHFPPPTSNYPQHGSASPLKSSPPPHQTQQQQYPGPYQPPHRPTQTPPNFRHPSTSDAQMQSQTPRQAHPSPAGSNATEIAAGGMSGPWPESSKSIPQKHDQSPAPPQPSLPTRETTLLPPVNLAPSPNQQQQPTAGPQSVPVKKIPASHDGFDALSSPGSVPMNNPTGVGELDRQAIDAEIPSQLLQPPIPAQQANAEQTGILNETPDPGTQKPAADLVDTSVN